MNKLQRYVNPHWLLLRLAKPLAKIIGDPLLMNLIGITARYSSEPEITQLQKIIRSDGIALDVGAAYGLYSWHLSRLTKECIAFEANPESAAVLTKRLPGMVIHAIALSSSCGTTKLRIPKMGSLELTGFSTIEPRNTLERFDECRELEIPMRTIDSFNLDNVCFIKIDVEGHELEVLKGGEKTIIRDKPDILVEISDFNSEGSESSVEVWLRNFGYQKLPIKLSPQNHFFTPIQ
ncbi:MAG: FkbM family methyltransferase [Cyanobacteriota bacterium]